jgi:uncharacterized phage infection (PIP) family protein YhgE
MPSVPNNFVNLQSYLNANQGAIHNTAQTLADKDTQAAQNAQNEAGDVAKGVQTQATAQGPNNTFDPTQADGYAKAQWDQSKAAMGLADLGSTGGVNRQLQDVYGHGNYTAGDRGLDSTLLRTSGDAQGQFKAAQDRFSGLDHYLQDTTGSAQEAGNAAYAPPAAPVHGPATQGTTAKPAPFSGNLPPERRPGVYQDYHKPVNGWDF